MSEGLLFIVMALASYRLWRFIGQDEIPGERIREAIERQIEKHEHVNERAGRRWGTIQRGVECPWCFGSWVAFGVVAVTAQLSTVPLPILQALGAACLVGLIGSALDH